MRALMLPLIVLGGIIAGAVLMALFSLANKKAQSSSPVKLLLFLVFAVLVLFGACVLVVGNSIGH
jgi:ABC-type Na+ efflux pump permease subunit